MKIVAGTFVVCTVAVIAISGCSAEPDDPIASPPSTQNENTTLPSEPIQEDSRTSPEEVISQEEKELLFESTTGNCWMENPCEANVYIVDNLAGEEPEYIMYVDFVWTGDNPSDAGDHILGVLTGVADSYPLSLGTYTGSVVLNIDAEGYERDEAVSALESAGLRIDDNLNPRRYNREEIPITVESLKTLSG